MYTQIPLFNRPPLNIAKQYKMSLHAAAKACHLSREQILDRMNELATINSINLVSNGKLKMDTFEKWLNPNDSSRQMPISALPVFCFVVGDASPIDVLAAPVGAKVIEPKDYNLLKWARAYFKARDCRKAMRQLENDL
jgi:hypothetical protein